MFVSALSDPMVGSIGIGLPGDLYILGKLLACEIFLPGLSHCCKIFQTRLSSVWNKASLEAGEFVQWNTLLANKTGKWHILMDGGGGGVGVGAEWGVLYCWPGLKLAENMGEASWLSPHEYVLFHEHWNTLRRPWKSPRSLYFKMPRALRL